MLTKPLVLNNVPKCGPERDKNVCNRVRSGLICGRDKADRTIIVPSE